MGTDAVTNGIGEQIRELLAAFYAHARLVHSRDPVFLQFVFATLIKLFESVGLVTNTAKTETMICIPGRICASLAQEAYNNRLEGHTNM